MSDSHPSIWDLKKECLDKMNELKSSGKIKFEELSSYQGRLGHTPNHDSTNGCSVISYLNVVNHISKEDNEDILNDPTIQDIMDNRAPPLLKEIREDLQLRNTEYIDQWSVQDHLMTQGLLQEGNYVGFCGNNILDENFITNEFIPLLENRVEGKLLHKSGAVLFFKEHLVAIIQIPRANGECWYDLIESLPSPDFNYNGYRMRSYGVDSLGILIRWYAFSRLYDRDLQYINDNYDNFEDSGGIIDGEWVGECRQCQFIVYCHEHHHHSSAVQ